MGLDTRLSDLCRVRPLHVLPAGVQYCGHEAAVTGLAVLPGSSRLVASVDSAGALHLWSAASGTLAWRFEEPNPSTVSGLPGAGAEAALFAGVMRA